MKETKTYNFYNSRDIPEELRNVGVKSPGTWSVTTIKTDSGTIKTRVELLSTNNETRRFDVYKPLEESKITPKSLQDVISLVIVGNQTTQRITLGQSKILETIVDIPDEYQDKVFLIWEESTDSTNWETIQNKTTPFIDVSPSVTTSYRLKVTGVGLSGIVYSPVIRVFVEQHKTTQKKTTKSVTK
jgi:hypothetical protein